jgi:hypothetical protein
MPARIHAVFWWAIRMLDELGLIESDQVGRDGLRFWLKRTVDRLQDRLGGIEWRLTYKRNFVVVLCKCRAGFAEIVGDKGVRNVLPEHLISDAVGDVWRRVLTSLECVMSIVTVEDVDDWLGYLGVAFRSQ